MDEYISREELIDKLKMWLAELEADKNKGYIDELYENKGAREAVECCIAEIETLPATDVQPVKHGRWELTDNPSFRKCSECGAWWSSDITDNCFTNYCPKCGARLDLKE